MKKYPKYVAVWLVMVMLCLLPFSGAEAAAEKELTLLFTHDLHSFFLPFRVPEGKTGFSETGGYARLESLIQKNRAGSERSLLIDAGDLSMGTLFHTIFKTEAAEIRLMGEMGYDVVTFGNHDFDFHADGLAAMLDKAKSKKARLPEIVASNVLFKSGPGAEALKRSFRDLPVREYTVLEKGGIRIGLFGLMGKDASGDMASAREIAFADQVETARKMVDLLKNREKADLIVCLSHSGTSKIKKHSEDEILAREVPGIDVIISGHTHTTLPSPILVGKTVLVSSGCYGAYLGVLKLSYSREAGAKIASYELQPVSAQIPENKDISRTINGYKDNVDSEYLAGFGYRFDQVVAESGFNMESLSSISARHGEAGLGDIITDAFRFAIERAEGNRYDYLHVALKPIGLIRDTITAGPVTVSDVFRVLSLGLGEDGQPGYPLVSYYINGKELKSLLEVHTSIAPFKNDAHMQISGIRFSFNPNRVPFERVTSILVRGADGAWRTPDPDRLYRICADIYTARRINYIRTASHGLIDIRPKLKDGRDLPELKDAIVYAQSKNGQRVEVKEWTALAAYLSSFPEKNERGIARIPERYSGTEGRITEAASWNPVLLVAGGGMITYGVLAVGILLLILIIWLIVRLARLIARRTAK